MIKIENLVLLFTIIFSNISIGQHLRESVTLNTETGTIKGTLLTPELTSKIPVVLIIAGSGPTDRNGNLPMFTNNSLKMLAEGLYENGIASLRFDKRGIGESKEAGTDESNLRFEHYVDDVKAWGNLLKKDGRFNDLIILGHSEGSLIGMVAAKQLELYKFISIAGAGFPAGEIIMKQLKAGQSETIIEQSGAIIEKLKNGKIVENVPQMLFPLFRKSVQPYLISWFKYNPATEISKLDCPILIVQGTTDIQVKVEDANALAEASKNPEKVIIDGMNHVLKSAKLNKMENITTYNNPNLPLKENLVSEIVNFIKADNR